MQQQSLNLFALDCHILPDGRLPLRLFEPHHLQILKESFIDDQGFGIVMTTNATPSATHDISPIGTRVQVIDFDILDDGVLGVTVIGLERFRIENSYLDHQDVLRATVTPLPNWPHCAPQTEDMLLAHRLREMFDHHPHLDQLYPDKDYNNATWLYQRWLELLPLPINEKQSLIGKQSYEETRHFLHQIITF